MFRAEKEDLVSVQNLEKSTFTGNFKFNKDREFPGILKLTRRKSCLDIWDEDWCNISDFWKNESIKSVMGIVSGGEKVSLIDCVEERSHIFGMGVLDQRKGSINDIKFSVNYAVFGDEHISHDEKAIKEASFLVDDANILFHDPDVFGGIGGFYPRPDPKPFLKEILQSRNENSGNIEIGEHSIILYYTGEDKIIEVDTSEADKVLEKVSVERNIGLPSSLVGGPDGVRIENEVYITLQFINAVTFQNAVQRVLGILHFLELLAGRPQNLVNFLVRRQTGKELSRPLQVYIDWFPEHERSESEQRPQSLVDAVQNPKRFSSLTKGWLKRDEDWRAARGIFFGCFMKHVYDNDRLIGAASMFDFLPDDAVSIEDETEKKSIEKDRVVKSKLGRRIESRAQYIIEKIGNKVPNISYVIKESVDCRNYYVHGGKPKINYEETGVFPFFVDTLEFIFAASDLIEAGWDIQDWYDASRSHPFYWYLADYEDNLRELKRLCPI